MDQTLRLPCCAQKATEAAKAIAKPESAQLHLSSAAASAFSLSDLQSTIRAGIVGHFAREGIV